MTNTLAKRYLPTVLCAILVMSTGGLFGCETDPALRVDDLEAMGLSEAELLGAVETGDTAHLSQLLGNHPELLEWRDERDRTLLHHASLAQQMEVVKLFIDRGADIYAQDEQGELPLENLPGAMAY